MPNRIYFLPLSLLLHCFMKSSWEKVGSNFIWEFTKAITGKDKDGQDLGIKR